MEGYQGLPAYYSQSSDPTTPNLGLALKAMDPIVAENFVIIDTAFGSGSSIEVNGTLVLAPNLSSTLPVAPVGNELVTFQFDSNGNISGYVPTGGGGSGTVTSVGTAGIATGGPITTAGTVTVLGSGNTTTAATANANLAAAPNGDVLVSDGNGNVKDSGILLSAISSAWSALTGTLSNGQVIPYGDTGISRLSAGVLAIGDGANGDVSGTLALTYLSLDHEGAVEWSSASTGAIDTAFYRVSAGTVALGDGAAQDISGTLQLSNLLHDYVGVESWASASTATIDTGISRISAGLLGIGNGSAGDFSGSLSLANATHTSVNATPGTASSTAGFVLLKNTTPTVTGAATTLAISAVSTTSGVSTYTIASTTGAGSNGWKGASITVAGFSGANAGNNGTFIVTASTTTTVVVNNASGTSAGTGTMITSAVVNSPILQIAGTVNTGTSGTLNSVADVWSIQNVLGSVAPNPTSTLTITHSGTTGTASVSMPGLSISSAVATFNVSSDILFDIGSSPLWEILSTTLRGGSGQNLSWSSSATANGATQDTTISRNAAGIVQVGTTSANASGNLAASSFAANGVVASPTAGIYYSGGTAGVSAGPFSAITSIQTIGGIVTTLADVSDERLKDHSPYLGGLQEILGITPIKYRWNQAGQKITGFDDTSSFVGFSAQDVQRTIPEAVRGSASNPEYLGFSDRPVIAALVNAVKELTARLEALETI